MSSVFEMMLSCGYQMLQQLRVLSCLASNKLWLSLATEFRVTVALVIPLFMFLSAKDLDTFCNFYVIDIFSFHQDQQRLV